MATNDPPVNLRDAFFMVMISGQIESAEVIITHCGACILCVANVTAIHMLFLPPYSFLTLIIYTALTRTPMARTGQLYQ